METDEEMGDSSKKVKGDKMEVETTSDDAKVG
jgi:hypothetical protein